MFDLSTCTWLLIGQDCSGGVDSIEASRAHLARPRQPLPAYQWLVIWQATLLSYKQELTVLSIRRHVGRRERGDSAPEGPHFYLEKQVSIRNIQ